MWSTLARSSRARVVPTRCDIFFLVHQVQQRPIVDRRTGAIVVVKQFPTPVGREDASGGIDLIDAQLEATQLSMPCRAVGPDQRKGGTYFDDGRGVAVSGPGRQGGNPEIGLNHQRVIQDDRRSVDPHIGLHGEKVSAFVLQNRRSTGPTRV